MQAVNAADTSGPAQHLAQHQERPTAHRQWHGPAPGGKVGAFGAVRPSGWAGYLFAVEVPGKTAL